MVTIFLPVLRQKEDGQGHRKHEKNCRKGGYTLSGRGYVMIEPLGMDDDIANAICKRDNCSNTCAADCFIDYFIHKARDGVGHD